jgi:hypothetical protein
VTLVIGVIRVQLQGANLDKAHIEGGRFDKAALTHAYIHHAYVWRAAGAICDDAQVTEPKIDLMLGLPDRERNATKDEATQSIDEWGQQLTREEHGAGSYQSLLKVSGTSLARNMTMRSRTSGVAARRRH